MPCALVKGSFLGTEICTSLLTFVSFNSFSQQICVDDAVVADPDRAENVVTNDGTTMRILAQASAKPSAWNRQKEVVTDDRAKTILGKQKLEEFLHNEEESPLEDQDTSDDGAAKIPGNSQDTDQLNSSADKNEDSTEQSEDPTIENQSHEEGSSDVDTEDNSSKSLEGPSIEDQPEEEETDMDLFIASKEADTAGEDKQDSGETSTLSEALDVEPDSSIAEAENPLKL
jgi:hypothetical protein